MSPTNLPTMPAPPLWETMFLESPYGAVLALVVGAVAAWFLRRAGRPRGAMLALGLGVGLGIGAYALDAAVRTPREAASGQTLDFVRAVVEEDAATVDRLMSQRMELAASGQSVGRIDRDTFVRIVGDLDGAVVSNRTAIDGAAAEGPNLVTVRFKATTTVREEAGFTAVSIWEIDWARDHTGAWRAIKLNSLWFRGLATDVWVSWALKQLG